MEARGDNTCCTAYGCPYTECRYHKSWFIAFGQLANASKVDLSGDCLTYKEFMEAETPLPEEDWG